MASKAKGLPLAGGGRGLWTTAFHRTPKRLQGRHIATSLVIKGGKATAKKK